MTFPRLRLHQDPFERDRTEIAWMRRYTEWPSAEPETFV